MPTLRTNRREVHGSAWKCDKRAARRPPPAARRPAQQAHFQLNRLLLEFTFLSPFFAVQVSKSLTPGSKPLTQGVECVTQHFEPIYIYTQSGSSFSTQLGKGALLLCSLCCPA